MRHRRGIHLFTVSAVSAGALVLGPTLLSAQASTVVRTDTPVPVDAPYVKANGSAITPGDAISACGTNRRQQNEPSAAVDARNA